MVEPVHSSDCALNNGPALPVGPCDCGHDALIDALRPFAWYFDVNDCKDRSEDDAIEVPIRDLRIAFELFEALGLKVEPSHPVGGAR